jgi:putative ABC transport system permease protein
VLATAAAAAGFVLCRLTTGLIAYLEPGIRTLDTNVVYSWPVVTVCAGLALLTAKMVTAPVALSLTQINVYESLKEGGRGGGVGVRRQRIRGMLVSAEVALALSLMVVSGLLARSFVSMVGADLGFRPENVLVLESALSDNAYNTAAKRVAYYRPLLRALSELPGVSAAGGLRYFPMHARLWTSAIQIQENPFPPAQLPVVYWNRVAGDYFDAMGIPLVAGRLPSAREMCDDAGSRLALVNATAARTLFPDGRAVGKRIVSDGGALEVIGVVGSVRQASPGRPPGPEIYALMASGESTGIVTIAIRARQQPDAHTVQTIIDAVKRHDNSQTRPSLVSMASFLGNTVGARRAAARLGSAFAILSLVLAALGIYGLVSYWVTQRTAEFGIRMALGASQGNVMRLVVGHCLKLTSIGIAVGLAVALVLAKVISSFLFGIPAFDPVTFIVAPLVLLVVATLAAARPAFSATRINTVDALRSE